MDEIGKTGLLPGEHFLDGIMPNGKPLGKSTPRELREYIETCDREITEQQRVMKAMRNAEARATREGRETVTLPPKVAAAARRLGWI
jgi:hypothetical protein